MTISLRGMFYAGLLSYYAFCKLAQLFLITSKRTDVYHDEDLYKNDGIVFG